MKNFFKPILNKKGLTLAEILVVLFISSVILVITANLMKPVQDLLNSVRSNAHIETLCDTANEFIRGSVQTAKTLNFYRLNANNEFVSDDEKNNAISKCSNANVIAVLNVGTDAKPVYRLFDFGKVANYSTLESYVSAHDEGLYGVFNEPFYEGSSYAVEFDCESPWLQVRSQCKKYTDSGVAEQMNRKRELKFNLLNGTIEKPIEDFGFEIDGEGGVEETDDEVMIEGGSYLIFYTKLDISTT